MVTKAGRRHSEEQVAYLSARAAYECASQLYDDEAGDTEDLDVLDKIAERHNLEGLYSDLLNAETGLTHWALSRVKQLPEYAQHAELVAGLVERSQGDMAVRAKIVALAMRLGA